MGTFAWVTMSLDGFIAPEGMDLDHADDFEYKNWMNKWNELQKWTMGQRFFRENLGLGEGGETGPDNQLMEDSFDRTGVSIMGKRMFDGGEMFWPEEAPFHTPVFVVTHQQREPWARPGGTTFYFVNDGIESALERAREAAGPKDIRIAGGGNVVSQYLAAGLVDELVISVSPLIFGGGTPLFSEESSSANLEISDVIDSPLVTHVKYRLQR